jgi:(R)-2-hydroxyacyl-CoA dehydratese activating ATPase
MKKGRHDTMAVAGVDVGAANAKAIILKNNKIVGHAIAATGHDVSLIAETVLKMALAEACLGEADLQYIVATGYGRNATDFAHHQMSEIICHAAGAVWMEPGARTVIDIGGQDSKVIRMDQEGNVVEFKMNDKCAAGTGRFLEVMAKVLGLTTEDASHIGMNSKDPCILSNVCTVFAESEVVSYRAQKRSREDIIAGIHWAATKRVAMMAKIVGIEDDVVFTGGVANNVSVVKFMEKEIGHRITVPKMPEIIGALGAALYAEKRRGRS